MSIILKDLFCKTNVGQKAISYIVPSIWNSWPDSIKRANILNTFKHNVKNHYLFWITHDMFMCMFICISIWLYVRVCVCIYICIYISVFSFELFILKFFMIFFVYTFLSFFSNLRDHSGNKALLPVLCYGSQGWCYSFLSAEIFQLHYLYVNF